MACHLHFLVLLNAILLLAVAASRDVKNRVRRVPSHHPSPLQTSLERSEKSSLFDTDLRTTTAASLYTKAELDLKPCVIVRFYDKQANALPSLLFSLLASEHPHLKALVIDTGKEPYEKLSELLGRVNRASGKRWVQAYKGTAPSVRSAFPKFHHEDFGYVLTDMALEDILKTKKGDSRSASFSCDTLTFTNADNLYSPLFLPAMLKSISHGNDMVASHFVSHYPFPAERNLNSFDELTSSEAGCGTLRGGMDAEFVTSDQFIPWCVELGSVMVTTKAVDKANIRFVIDMLRKDGTGTSVTRHAIHVADPKINKVVLKTFENPSDFFASADGNFFYKLASQPNVVANTVQRVLMLHL